MRWDKYKENHTYSIHRKNTEYQINEENTERSQGKTDTLCSKEQH